MTLLNRNKTIYTLIKKRMSRGDDSGRGIREKPMRKRESAGKAWVVPRVATAEADQAHERCRVFPQMLTLTADLTYLLHGVESLRS
jgi:hypothetical protein